MKKKTKEVREEFCPRKATWGPVALQDDLGFGGEFLGKIPNGKSMKK